jgi:hypothetical protein
MQRKTSETTTISPKPIGGWVVSGRSLEIRRRRSAIWNWDSSAHLSQLRSKTIYSAIIAFARSLWLRGFPDRAGRVMRQAIDEAEQGGHPGALGLCLIWACSVSLWCGARLRRGIDAQRARCIVSRAISWPVGDVFSGACRRTCPDRRS